LAGFEWGLRRENEKEPGKTKFLACGLSDKQMAQVNRVERAAKQA